jgi:hypothetical protein
MSTSTKTPTATSTTKTVKEPKVNTKQKETEVKNEHPLQNLVPSADWHEHYVSRDIAGINDLAVLRSAWKLGHNVLISGPTGSAKTSLTYAYASKHNLPVVNVPCNGAAEPSLFIGRWNRLKDGSYDFVLGELAQAVLHGGVILLDEVNFLKPNIGAYLHGLLDGRRTLNIPEAQGSSAPTSIKAHDDCLIVAALNPNYEGTRPLNKAFKNRFAFKLEFPYLAEVEEQLVQSESLLTLANNLRREVEAGNIETPVSTNLLIETEELALDDELGFDFALTNFLSSFPAEEQQPVREVLVQVAPNIYKELFEGEYPEDGLFSPVTS